MDRTTSKLLSHLLGIGLPFLYLLTSISFYLHTYDSAQVKITIVQMLGSFLMGLWYTKLVCDQGRSLRGNIAVAAPLLAALASGVLSFSHTAYQGPSLDEFLRRVFYIHFALIALTEINTQERFRRMIKFLLIATALATVYGFVQFIDGKFFGGQPGGVDPFIWRGAFGGRVFSTFGNPNFFGNFLVIVMPITLALLMKRHAEQTASVLLFAVLSIFVSAILWHSDLVLGPIKMLSWDPAFVTLVVLAFCFWTATRYSFLGILFFLITLNTVVTVSKGAWIGYAGSFLTFLMLVLFYFSQFRSEKTKRTIQQAALFTLVICSVAVGFYSRQRADSVRFRIATWVSTWEMGLMHPVWGNGVGSFRVLYPAFRRPQIFHIEGKHNTETDHAENEYWEVFMDEGLIGIGIFLWMIATFSVLGIRGLRRFTEGMSIRDPSSGKRKLASDPRAFYMLGCLAAFWGMLMHNFMDVSLRFVSSGIFLWLLAGLIGAMVIHDPMAENDEQRYAREPASNDPPALGGSPLLYAGSAIAAVLFGQFVFKIFPQFNNVQGATPAGFGEMLLWSIAWVAFAGTVALGAWWVFRIARSLKTAYAFIPLCLMVPALHVFWGYFMADAYHNRGIFYSKNQQWDTAIENYRRVVALNPNYIMAYYFMGNVYTDRWQGNDVESAMREYGRVWAIAPNYVQSHHQAGLVYLKKGQDSRRKFEELVGQSRAQPGNVALKQQVALALQLTKDDYNQAIKFFHKYHGIDPVFEPNYARWGFVHAQLAELANYEGNPREVDRQLGEAERLYSESLNATVCGAPYNDVLRERWDRNHRHFNSEMFKNLGDVRFMRGNLDGAARAYRLAIWQDKNNLVARKNLAATLTRLGRQAEMQQVWLDIRALAPQDPDVQRVFSHAPVAPRR